MKITCPNCGGTVQVNHLGRKSLNIHVKNVSDALQLYHSISDAAESLNCSRALIYKVLKDAGLTAKGVIGKVT